MAEREKQRTYKKELDEQHRLCTFRNLMNREREKNNEKELLTKQTDYVQTKLREKAENELRGPSPIKHYRHLLDSSLMHKIRYSESQRKELMRDQERMHAEYEKNLDNVKREEQQKKEQSKEIASTLQELYNDDVVTESRTRVVSPSYPNGNVDSRKNSEFHDYLDAVQVPHYEDILQYGKRSNFGITRVPYSCLLYTSDAADDTPCVDLGGRRIIKKKKQKKKQHKKEKQKKKNKNDYRRKAKKTL
eukprot:TRINITY_DN16095_c0_g1_i2.p1 TRINITY_DN16095_c0_g1~~TRINITY_DN16095_c0_g1_i2.p1  ORF type:complete len:254 (-),score=67.32 TRINITY_DN16095_c0_g1_i2:25-765(-)